jgi:hypothetical protein
VHEGSHEPPERFNLGAETHRRARVLQELLALMRAGNAAAALALLEREVARDNDE